MTKQNVVYSYIQILYSFEEELSTDTWMKLENMLKKTYTIEAGSRLLLAEGWGRGKCDIMVRDIDCLSRVKKNCS
jgi:hypothetical protein